MKTINLYKFYLFKLVANYYPIYILLSKNLLIKQKEKKKIIFIKLFFFSAFKKIINLNIL